MDRVHRTARARVRPMAAALLAAVAVAGVLASAAGPAGAAPGDGVVRGGANASADSMAFLINNAGAALGWTFGRSTAQYRRSRTS